MIWPTESKFGHLKVDEYVKKCIEDFCCVYLLFYQHAASDLL